jgi:transposase
LQNFRGYLQADAFGGYDGIYTGSNGAILEVACFAHARRKYFEARGTDSLRAETTLAYIRRLYAIERQIKDRAESEWRELACEERHARIAAVRQEQARPVLEQFLAWVSDEAPKLLPKHPVRQAMDYTLGNWQALARYTDHGFLAIDNNAAENNIRRIAIGRKNLMTFCQPSRRISSANGPLALFDLTFAVGGERRRRLASTVDPTLIRGLVTPG